VRRRVGREIQKDHRPNIGQRFVHHDALDSLHAEMIFQMREEQRLVGDDLLVTLDSDGVT
jgi:hypothetical protein